jgi:hypothetical protein
MVHKCLVILAITSSYTLFVYFYFFLILQLFLTVIIILVLCASPMEEERDHEVQLRRQPGLCHSALQIHATVYWVILFIFLQTHFLAMYVLTCKYGRSNGFFFAIAYYSVALGWWFDLSTGLFICLHNLGLRMIAKWTASFMVMLQSRLTLYANKVHHFSLILCVCSDLSTNVFLSDKKIWHFYYPILLFLQDHILGFSRCCSPDYVSRSFLI